jgi:hypothetical protein
VIEYSDHTSGSCSEVGGEVGHASRSCFEVGGEVCHAFGSCSEVIGCSGTGDGETKGADKMHGRGHFYSRALRGGNAGQCKEREREVTARCRGRASVLTRAARRGSDVVVAAALRGGDAEGVCLYTVGEEVSRTRGRIDAATRHTQGCQRMVTMWHGARELEARWAACGVNKEGGSRGAA